MLPFKALDRIADVLEELRRLYSLELSSRGIVQEVGTEEGEILYDESDPRTRFQRETEVTEGDDAQQREEHLEFLRELERESLRVYSPSGFTPGVGPDGAEDPSTPVEVSGGGRAGASPPAEGQRSSEKQEG
jgi:hypothetical protein